VVARSKVHGLGKQMSCDSEQSSALVAACRSPVVAPYFRGRPLQDPIPAYPGVTLLPLQMMLALDPRVLLSVAKSLPGGRYGGLGANG